MRRLLVRTGVVALAAFHLLALPAKPEAATASAVYVDVRESDARDAEVVERWKIYDASYALVVGIDNYSEGWPRLSNAVKDARLVAEELKGRGFEVELLTDVGSQDLRSALRRFFAVKGEDPEARLFLWFAGHGHTEFGEGYLVPADAPAAGGSGFRLSALHLGNIGTMVRLARAKHIFAVFDSCFAGTIFSSQRARPPAAITRAVVRPVRQFLTSGDADQEVSDDGTFRKLFLDALRGEEEADLNTDGYLTGSELSFYLEDRMINLTRAVQTPRSGKLRDPRFDRGDFVFVQRSEQEPQTPVTSPQIALQTPGPSKAALDLEFWQAVKDSKDPADLEEYLKRFSKGTFSGLARRRLAELQRSKVAAVPPKAEPEIESMEAPYVARRNANVRVGPSAKHDKVGFLDTGTTVTVTGKVKGADWYRVALAGGADGYVYAPLLGEEPAAKPPGAASPQETQMAVGVFSPRSEETFRDCPTCPEMAVIRAGSFMMGSPESEDERDANEGPRREVTISQSFAIGKFEVTFDEWDACVAGGGCSGYRFGGVTRGRGRQPVTNMNWRDAKAYVTWLRQETDKAYRLLSEAEWEYAARAGTTTRFSFGDEISEKDANFGSNLGKPTKVGSYPANPWNLHDMHGNVWEWVEDCWNESYSEIPTGGIAWTSGQCNRRVLRGGSWDNKPLYLRSATRFGVEAGFRNHGFGFRVARAMPKDLRVGQEAVAALPKTEPEIESMEAPYVAHRNANVRAGPSAKHDRVGFLDTGTAVTVTGKVKGVDWYRVALVGGANGYVYAPLLGEDPPAKPAVSESLQDTQVAVGAFDRIPVETFRDCPDCPEMVAVLPGSFMMGSPDTEQGRDDNEGPQRRVDIPRRFAVGKYEVTRAEFAEFVKAEGRIKGDGCFVWIGDLWVKVKGKSWHDPGYEQTDRDPVTCVSWANAQAYAEWLSDETGQRYRLLTEAEWEYVARAGSTTRYWWGDAIGSNLANCDGCGSSWDRKGTAPPGSFDPNQYGLHDTVGNVWEWVEDCWNDSYQNAPRNGTAWTTGNCRLRVLRGGSWFLGPVGSRSADRNKGGTGYRSSLIGFRVARTPP